MMTDGKRTNQRLKSRQKHNVYKLSEKKKQKTCATFSIKPNLLYIKHTKIMWPPPHQALQSCSCTQNPTAIQCANRKKKKRQKFNRNYFSPLPLNSFCSDWWVTAFTSQSGSSAAWRRASHGDECIFTVLQTVVSKIQTRRRIWPGNTHLPCCKLCWDFCFATQLYDWSLIIKSWRDIWWLWFGFNQRHVRSRPLFSLKVSTKLFTFVWPTHLVHVSCLSDTELTSLFFAQVWGEWQHAWGADMKT